MVHGLKVKDIYKVNEILMLFQDKWLFNGFKHQKY